MNIQGMMYTRSKHKLNLERVTCCICDSDAAKPVGVGYDFEYLTSADDFVAMRCDSCDLVYLNPRPAISEFETIYPTTYHAFDFSEKDFGLVHKIRSWLEAKRLLSWCRVLPDDARIVDVGCGDGFHLKLLREHGNKGWRLEGIDIDHRAAEMAERLGIEVHLGTVETLELEENGYDFAFMVQTIEHVAQPEKVLSAILKILKPGGKLTIVTDNTDSIDFGLFKNGYWGGYHFPRHWNLFNGRSLRTLTEKCGFSVAEMTTQVSPVNWVYSIHNGLVDLNAPKFLVNRFTLRSPVSLSAFTSLDILLQKLGRGALMRATLEKPEGMAVEI